MKPLIMLLTLAILSCDTYVSVGQASPPAHAAYAAQPATAPRAMQMKTITPVSNNLVAVNPSQLVFQQGKVFRTGGTSFMVDESIRADVGRQSFSSVQLSFVYRGNSSHDIPLTSGELRRQIGVRLRAANTCNVVYAVWHISPDQGIWVLVKHNPGKWLHEHCGDGGYQVIKPKFSAAVPIVQVGQRHTLFASIVGDELHVVADGKESWMGQLPPEAFEQDGPVGIRTDNARFDVEMMVGQ